MTSKKLSRQKQDFADAMALKLRLDREQRKKEEDRKDLSKNTANFGYRLREE